MDNLQDKIPFCRQVRKTAVVEVKQFSNTDVYTPGTEHYAGQEVITSDESDDSDKNDDSGQSDDSDKSDDSGQSDDSDESDDSSQSNDSHESDDSGQSYDLEEYLYSACRLQVYPNGWDNSSEGQVSLEFELDFCRHKQWLDPKSAIGHVETKCVVAVVDAQGCRRFPQTFAFTQDFEETEGSSAREPKNFVDNYLSRDFLLGADDLLPNDTLTVLVDLFLNIFYLGQESNDRLFHNYLRRSVRERGADTREGDRGQDTRRYWLRLQSPFAKLLLKQSQYVQRLFSRSMVEREAGCVEIPKEEYGTFLKMLMILFHLQKGGIELEFKFQRIVDVYVMAHFYGGESVLDTCKFWLRIVSCRFPDFYGDCIPREIADGTLTTNDDKIEQWTCDAYEPYNPTMSSTWDGSSTFFFYLPSKTRSGHVTEDVGDISNSYV